MKQLMFGDAHWLLLAIEQKKCEVRLAYSVRYLLGQFPEKVYFN